jgi:integrase
MLLLPEFQKFIKASSTGRRRMPSGKRITKGTIDQYQYVYNLLQNFELSTDQQPLQITLHKHNSLRQLKKEKNYWERFFRQFSNYLYQTRKCYDQYAATVFRIIKTFFRYLAIDKALPVGEHYKKFRIPPEKFSPVIITPSQLRRLIIDKEFEAALSAPLKRAKDIFVFGCTVALRYNDLMKLRTSHLQTDADGTNLVLHTQKTGAKVRIPLPAYAIEIIKKYRRKNGSLILPQLLLKELIKKAGWDQPLPRIRHRRGQPVEIRTDAGKTARFYQHITAHTMRRTAITTLLMLGVDEATVRRISGHAPGSREFYRYVVVVQDYLNSQVKAAHEKLMNEPLIC